MKLGMEEALAHYAYVHQLFSACCFQVNDVLGESIPSSPQHGEFTRYILGLKIVDCGPS